jgi:hypothetical protein
VIPEKARMPATIAEIVLVMTTPLGFWPSLKKLTEQPIAASAEYD